MLNYLNGQFYFLLKNISVAENEKKHWDELYEMISSIMQRELWAYGNDETGIERVQVWPIPKQMLYTIWSICLRRD